jgi:hypothetical protein
MYVLFQQIPTVGWKNPLPLLRQLWRKNIIGRGI